MRLLKLVRDRIPEMFGDAEIVYQPIPREEFLFALRNKLVEEAQEYRDNPCREEMADVYEAMGALIEIDLDCYFGQIMSIAEEKREKRGGFYDGIGMYLRRRL